MMKQTAKNSKSFPFDTQNFFTVALDRVPQTNKSLAEILVTSIITDEGILAPYGIGEINLKVQYQV